MTNLREHFPALSAQVIFAAVRDEFERTYPEFNDIQVRYLISSPVQFQLILLSQSRTMTESDLRALPLVEAKAARFRSFAWTYAVSPKFSFTASHSFPFGEVVHTFLKSSNFSFPQAIRFTIEEARITSAELSPQAPLGHKDPLPLTAPPANPYWDLQEALSSLVLLLPGTVFERRSIRTALAPNIHEIDSRIWAPLTAWFEELPQLELETVD